MKAKYFLVHFTADGMQPLVAVGLTRSLVARAMKRQYGNRAIKKVVPTSRDGSVGYAHAAQSWSQISPISGVNPFMKEAAVAEAGYFDTPETEEELKKRHPNAETDVKNKDSKDLVMPPLKDEELTTTNEAVGISRGTWVVYDGKKEKTFKSHKGAMDYAKRHGGQVASSEYYADKIKGKKHGVNEAAIDTAGKKMVKSGTGTDQDPFNGNYWVDIRDFGDYMQHLAKKKRKPVYWKWNGVEYTATENTPGFKIKSGTGQIIKEALEDKKARVVEAMSTLLGTAYALQVKSQNFHWNIQGPDFIQYHKYLGEFYDLVAGHIDSIAEQIRVLDIKAPAGLKAFLDLSEIEEESSVPGALEMLNIIQGDVDILIATLEEANDAAEFAKLTGLANYLQDTIDQFSKQNWFLKSIQGRSLNESTIMVSEAAMKLEGKLKQKHRLEGTLSQKPKIEGTLKGVKINPDSPDANGDGAVDDKDDLNHDGVVDKKDLLIAQLEKDVRIRELQARLEELDDPAVEQEQEAAPDMPMRLRIKDRGTHFEAIDENGTCVQQFPYDNSQKYARDARYEAQRFAEKHWSEACGRMKREAVMKSGTMGEKKRVKLKEFAQNLLSKKSVVKEGFGRGFGEDDIAIGGTVIYKYGKKYLVSKAADVIGSGAGAKVRTRDGHTVPLRDVVSTDMSDWNSFKNKRITEEVGIGMANEVEKAFIVHYVDRDGNNGEELVKATGPGVAYRAFQHKAIESGYRVVDVTYDGKSMIDAARRETFRRRVAEEADLGEANAFIHAAIKAKKAGKKSFEFNGKKYKVTLKEDMDNIFEELDDKRLLALAKQGLVDQDQVAVFKQALSAINDGKPLLPKQRETMLAAFSKLASMVSGDSTLFNKARKLVGEESDELEEVSKKTLHSYMNKVSADSQKHSSDPTKRSPEKASRSVGGFAKAHNRLSKEEMDEPESELTEAKDLIPVDQVVKAVTRVLGSQSAARFATHLRPGTNKKVAWDDVNNALKDQGVKPKHIADILTHVAPAQMRREETEVSSVYANYISQIIRK